MDDRLLWRVTVDCWYRDKPRAKLHKRVRRTIIVRAGSVVDMEREAISHAESTAPIGPKWVAFEFVKANTVQLPLTVASFHSGARLAK